MSTLGQMGIFVPYTRHQKIIKRALELYSPLLLDDLDDIAISHVRQCLRHYLRDTVDIDIIRMATKALDLLELQK